MKKIDTLGGNYLEDIPEAGLFIVSIQHKPTKAYPFRSGHARCGDRRALTV
jgi:hypothetical protein